MAKRCLTVDIDSDYNDKYTVTISDTLNGETDTFIVPKNFEDDKKMNDEIVKKLGDCIAEWISLT